MSLNDIKLGNNFDYNAYIGWDPVTGLGSFSQYIYFASETVKAKYFSFAIIDDTQAKETKSKKELSVKKLKTKIEFLTKIATGILNKYLYLKFS